MSSNKIMRNCTGRYSEEESGFLIEYIIFDTENKIQMSKSMTSEKAKQLCSIANLVPISPLTAYSAGYFEYKKGKVDFNLPF